MSNDDGRSSGDIQKEIDAILDGIEVPDRRPHPPPPPRVTAKVDLPRLTRVIEGLGSPDAGVRAAAGAAVDTFIRERLGLTWTGVVDAIELVAAFHAPPKAAFCDPPPSRPDTEWRFFIDDDGQFGVGRRFRDHVVATKELFTSILRPGDLPKWTAALDGCVLRDAVGRLRLFPNMDEAQRVVEAVAMEIKR
jgi:hypothetical protein